MGTGQRPIICHVMALCNHRRLRQGGVPERAVQLANVRRRYFVQPRGNPHRPDAQSAERMRSETRRQCKQFPITSKQTCSFASRI